MGGSGSGIPVTLQALQDLQRQEKSLETRPGRKGALVGRSSSSSSSSSPVLDLNSWVAVGQVVSPPTLIQAGNFDSASLELFVGAGFPGQNDGIHRRDWLKIRVLIREPIHTVRVIETVRLGAFIMVKGAFRYTQPYDTIQESMFPTYVEAEQIVPLFPEPLTHHNGQKMGKDVTGSAQSMTLIGRILHFPRLIHTPDPMYLSTLLTETVCGPEEHQILQLVNRKDKRNRSFKKAHPPFRPGDRVHVVGRATVKTLEDEDGRCRFAIRIVAQKVQIILRARGS